MRQRQGQWTAAVVRTAQNGFIVHEYQPGGAYNTTDYVFDDMNQVREFLDFKLQLDEPKHPPTVFVSAGSNGLGGFGGVRG